MAIQVIKEGTKVFKIKCLNCDAILSYEKEDIVGGSITCTCCGSFCQHYNRMSRYIDVDALGIGKADRKAFEKPEYADGWNSAIKIIEEAPTADVVEVRHGEWLEQYEGSRLLKCSVCGYEYCDLIECRNYCGNCGAKMDGERSENGT
jgi:hypothetical protein